MEEGGKERTKEEVFAVVGCWWKYKKRKKKRKRKDETKGPATPHMENVSLFRVKFSPIKYYIKEEKRRAKNGATRV